MNIIHRKTFKLSIIIFANTFLLSSCVNAPPSLDRTFPSEQGILKNPKEEIQLLNKDTVREKKFDQYPDPEALKLNAEKGKINPFSLSDDFDLTSLVFQGIISDGKVAYAIVKYNELSGAIQKDQIGGVNTKLLPNGVKVKDIDLNKELLILAVKGQSYEIKLRKD